MRWFLGKISEKEALVIRKIETDTTMGKQVQFIIEEVDISEMTYTEKNMLPRLWKWPLTNRKFHYNRGDFD